MCLFFDGQGVMLVDSYYCRMGVVFVFRRSKAHLKVDGFHNQDHRNVPSRRFLGLNAEATKAAKIPY